MLIMLCISGNCYKLLSQWKTIPSYFNIERPRNKGIPYILFSRLYCFEDFVSVSSRVIPCRILCFAQRYSGLAANFVVGSDTQEKLIPTIFRSNNKFFVSSTCIFPFFSTFSSLIKSLSRLFSTGMIFLSNNIVEISFFTYNFTLNQPKKRVSTSYFLYSDRLTSRPLICTADALFS